MTIAILSDSHDRQEFLEQALETIKNIKVKHLLFCGDFCAPFMLRQYASIPEIQVHAVFGNNDGDRFKMAELIRSNFPHISLHGEYASLEIDHKRIGMTHYPFYANAMAKSSDYDLVVFGHDHEARILEFGGCFAVNPGSLMGNVTPPSFALYDPFAHAATLHHLDGSILGDYGLYSCYGH